MLGDLATFLFGPDTLVPQGYGMLWRPGLLALHLFSDLLIAIWCVIIAAGLWSFARRRTGLEHYVLYALMAGFILICGLTHFMGAVTIWYPLYGLHGILKAMAAVIGLGVAVLLWRTLPKALAIPTLGSLRDINRDLSRQLAEREGALTACKSELTAAHRELDAFTYTIAHDLRRPLTQIDTCVAKLAAEHGAVLDGQGRDQLECITEECAKTGTLIDDLLHMSRLTRVPLRITEVDLSELATGIINGFRFADPDRRVVVLIAKRAIVDCDRELMRIALTHLLKNAWKFTSKQENAKIEFGYQRRGAKTMFYIRDNGVGFDMAHAGKLFLPFQRLHEAAEFSGNGVGLAVVARIIHRHGGDIKAEASLGKGTSITFSI